MIFNPITIALVLTTCILTAVAFVVFWKRKSNDQSNRTGLFRFNDGLRVRSIDPIETLLALESHKELLLYRHPEQARNGNKDAIRICVDAIKNAFGVNSFTDPKLPGLTVTEMLNLLGVFIYYCETQKKSTNTSETSPVSSEEPTSNESKEPITVSLLGSGSIETAPQPVNL